MSAGCHRIIRQGWATLVTSPAEVLENLGDAGQLLQAGGDEMTAESRTESSSLFAANLSESQQKIMSVMDSELAINDIARLTTLPMHVIQSDLTMLEIRGAISRQAGKYAKKR
ncbi:MAG TPA: hypothetical protein DER01_02790 [Phycisphaerales bacterium]|nr:hypothetical protein [Phycisphaerales bacterium]